MTESAPNLDPDGTAAGAPDGTAAVVSDGTAVALSTRELASSEGRELWAETLDMTFCEMDVDWPRLHSSFDADITARPVGEMALSLVRADPHTVVRTPDMIASDPVDALLLCLVTKGAATITQRRRTSTLDAGAFGFVDSQRPFIVSGVTEFEQVVLRVPRDLFASRVGVSIDDAVGLRIDADSGVGRVASSMLVDLAVHDDDLGAGAVAAVASALLDVVSAAVDHRMPQRSLTDRVHADDLRTVQQSMLRHIGDPDHTIADVATELGMSVRYIHKLFSAAGTTPRTWLYGKRFERARSLLSDTDQSVHEIAERLGFRDVSHFSRSFRRTVGVSPRSFRNAGEIGPNRP